VQIAGMYLLLTLHIVLSAEAGCKVWSISNMVKMKLNT
jgi:hypothetical protein